MSEPIRIEEQDYCFLGKGSRLRGEVRLGGTSHIACRVEGDVLVEGGGTLTIGPTGTVLGNISCRDLEVFGTVNGGISSSGKVTVFPTGRIDGELESSDLVVHPGAKVDIDGRAGIP